VDGLASLVKVIGNRFVTSVFNVRNVFFEAGVKNTSSFTDVELSAFGTMNDVCNVVCQADELLRDVHLGHWASYHTQYSRKRPVAPIYRQCE